MTVGDIMGPYRRAALVLAAIVLCICMYPITNIVAIYATMSIDRSVPGVEVEYYHGLLQPQIFRIVIENVSGERYPTTISMYGWLPNGSIVELGKFFGKHGAMKIDVRRLVSYLKNWYRYLIAHGDNPAWIQPGIIILGVVHTSQGVYAVIKSVPLSIVDVLRGMSVEIRVVKKMTRNNVLISMDEVRKDIQRLEDSILRSAKSGSASSRSLANWPPGEIWGDCYCGKILCYCYIWKLDEVYAVAKGKRIPLVIAYLHGDLGEIRGYGSIDVVLSERFVTMEVFGVRIEVGFGITAAVKTSSGVSYEVPGFTLKLFAENHVWLDYYKTFRKGLDFDTDAILAVGVIGDLAFARYKLELCDDAMLHCEDKKIYANMTLAQPEIENNEMKPWSGVDYPYDGVGDLEKVMHYVMNHWSYKLRVGDDVRIDALEVKHEINTLPLFSLSMAVLPILMESAPEKLPFVAIMGISVGLTYEATILSYNYCHVILNDPNAYAIVEYFYSPVQFEYGGGKYYIGSLYVDAEIVKLKT